MYLYATMPLLRRFASRHKSFIDSYKRFIDKYLQTQNNGLKIRVSAVQGFGSL